MPDIFISSKNVEEKVEEKKEHSFPAVSKNEPKTEAERMALPGHTHNLFSSFQYYPERVGFETKEEEEKIILLLRQHFIVNLKWILVTTVMPIVPGVVKYLSLLSTLPANFEFVLTLTWYLLTMSYALQGFLSWYFNVYFVTNHRVVDVDFYNLINKKVSDADIDKIQDTSYTSFGVARLLFNFGDVFIQTAAEVSEFDFLAVPNPAKVVRIINDLNDIKK